MFKMIVANHTFTNADYDKNDFSINSIMALSKMKTELNLIFGRWRRIPFLDQDKILLIASSMICKYPSHLKMDMS